MLDLEQAMPEFFYIFVNALNPITAHNLKFTKQFFSASMGAIDTDKSFLEKYMNGTATYAIFDPGNPDCKALSPFNLSVINDCRIEYDAEQCRLAYYGKYPSRLSAVYAFGDFETCQEVSKKYGWPLSEVKKFRLVENPLSRIIRVNMEIVSLARHAYKVSSIQCIDQLWRSYWSGCGSVELELPTSDASRQVFNSGEIWEYLIEGFVKLAEEEES